jgi:hypothetical protein
MKILDKAEEKESNIAGKTSTVPHQEHIPRA